MKICYGYHVVLHSTKITSAKLYIFQSSGTIQHFRTLYYVTLVMLPPHKFVQPASYHY